MRPGVNGASPSWYETHDVLRAGRQRDAARRIANGGGRPRPVEIGGGFFAFAGADPLSREAVGLQARGCQATLALIRHALAAEQRRESGRFGHAREPIAVTADFPAL